MLRKVINKLLGKPKDAMDFGAAMRLCELPVVTFSQGDKNFNFLLDTGSNDSIIDSNILKDIEHKVTSKRNLLHGMEGIKKEVSDCIITLSFKDKDYTYDYLIQDLKQAFDSIKQETGVTLHGIIGSKFFNKFRYVLDFAELIAYSKQ